ncbi:MAG: HAD family phosphatase [Planctomycetia bacterium]|nr:HAD family phosphatase [Planctomycetia bacterium]
MPPAFIYFDLGNVLLFFDHALACRQMAAVAGLTETQVRDVVFDRGLQLRYETGEISTRQFYDTFCERTHSRPDYDALVHAAGAIFSMNASILPVVAHLRGAGHRLGLLSNTCEAHWAEASGGRFTLIPDLFEAVTLSFRVGAVKPDARIFQAAAEQARVPPREIFFVDDTPGHVAAAHDFGFDAVPYTTTPALVRELVSRGVRFNY